MATNTAQSGEFEFSIDSNLLFELGERLVTKPSIALAELVKNAYDADATEVIVTFENVDKSGGIMIIEDNGHGMTFEEMQNNWMRIATGKKREKPVSRRYCRPLSGAKGVGRLAARRLGTQLTLQSTAERSDEGILTKECVVVEFNWQKSFPPGQDLTKIPVQYTRKAVSLEAKTGVSLFIAGVRDAWTKEDITNLRRDLLSLQSPYPDLSVQSQHSVEDNCTPDPGFNFDLVIDNSGELKELAGELGVALLNSAWAKLEGEINKEGKAEYNLNIQQNPKGLDNLVDAENTYEALVGARFRIYFFVYRKDFFYKSSLNVRDATKKGREEGGVRIYLDGFRVFPYGDPGDDWLRLDEYGAKNINLGAIITPTEIVRQLANSLERPWLNIPKNNQLFGAVAISQVKHSDIEMNVTRDRLIETPAVANLRRFVQNGIYWATIKYAAYLSEEKILSQRRQEKEDIQRKEYTRSVLDIIDDVKAAITNQIGMPEERRSALLENLNKASERVKAQEEERISDISMLRILASAGTTLALMNHQLQAFVGAILQIKADMLRLRPAIPEHLHQQYDDITEQVTEWHNMVASQVSILGFLLSPDNRQRRRRLLLRQIVEDVKKPMAFYMKTYHVSFENNISPTLRTSPLYPAELYAILINILSNALKAIHGQTGRKISVGAEKTSQELRFWMMDTGVGIPVEHREQAFKPFYTTSAPNPTLGVGTGLGLTVVKDILDTYEGSARFVDAEIPWKTRIEIILPERSSNQ